MTKQTVRLAVFIVLFMTRGMVYSQSLPQDFGPGFAGYTLATPESSPKKVILLTNGRVVGGELFGNGDPIQVRNELGMITIPRSDMAMVGETLQDVYQFQKANAPKTCDGFLKLADWCVSNKLVNEAAFEFDRAILLSDDPQRADAIRNRKNAAMSMFGESRLQTQMVNQENQKYRQWKQKIPPATFATFKREILPMLVRNCNGIACHSGNSLNEFRFVANPHNSDVDVAKNLQVVLGYITPRLPEESPLVLIPIAAHGRTKQIFTRRNFAQYEKLYFWTEQVAGEMDAYYPLDEADRVVDVVAGPGNKRRPTAAPRESNNMPSPLVSGGMTSDSMPDELRGDDSIADVTPSQTRPSSLAQGFVRNTDSQNVPAQRQADFNFFDQQSIVPGGSVQDWSSRPEFQQEPKTNIMTHNGTDAFERNSVLQQLQRDPVDPFDPVLFNRQYHLRRLQVSDDPQERNPRKPPQIR